MRLGDSKSRVAYFTQEVPIDATTFDMDVANVTDGCGDSRHLLEHAVGRLKVQSNILDPGGANFALDSATDDGCGDSQHLLEHAVRRLEVQSGIFYPVGADFASDSAADGKFS